MDNTWGAGGLLLFGPIGGSLARQLLLLLRRAVWPVGGVCGEGRVNQGMFAIVATMCDLLS